MVGLIANFMKNFKEKNMQDVLVINMDHGKKIISKLNLELECLSINVEQQELWNADNILQSLEHTVPEVYKKHSLQPIIPSLSL